MSQFEELMDHAWPSLLAMLTTVDACRIRAASPALCPVIAKYPWTDATSKIVDLPAWRSCFPRARAAKVTSQAIAAGSFVHLRGLSTLDLSWANLGQHFSPALFSELTCVTHLNVSGNVLADPDVVVLAEAMGEGALPRLVVLDLSKNYLTGDGVRALAAVLVNSSLASLNLGSNDIGADGASMLATSLSRGGAPQLAILRLRSANIGVDGTRALSAALTARAPALRDRLVQLDLGYNKIGAEGARALGAALCCGGAPRLSVLELFGNKIGDAGISAVAAALSAGCVPLLRHLQLSYNDISADGARALAVGLRSSHVGGLTILELYGNNLGVEGMAALAPALGSVPALTLLGLCRNALGDDGLCALAAALGSLPSLLALEVSCNDVTSVGVRALAAALHRLPKLCELGLSYNNRLGPAGACALAAYLGDAPLLVRLDVDKSGIGSEGAAGLAAALSSGALPRLRTMNLSWNDIGAEGACALAAALDSSVAVPRLRELKMGGNDLGADGGIALAAAAARRSPPLTVMVDSGGGHVYT